MNTNYILYPSLLVSVLSANSISASNNESKPNVIVIFCDDMGYGDLGCFGHPTIQTPNLDKMAYEGQKWTSFYVSASVSSPSRSGLLTGRLGVRTGMYGNKRGVLFPNSKNGLPKEEVIIPEMLKTAGYTTACIGKWHLGHKEEFLPLNHGFDRFYGAPFSNDMSKKEQVLLGNKKYPYEYIIYDQEEIVAREPDQTNLTRLFTEQATAFIKSQKQNPFFLYLAHPMPHIPVYASEEFQGKSLRGKYGDSIEELDWSVGEILKALKEQELDENTLVVFSSDNGPWLPHKELGGSAGTLRDGKGSMYEGGFRVPCIMWGGMVKAGHVSQMGSTLDLLPTFCELANVDLPADREYDGVSLLNVLLKKEESKREAFFFYRGSDLYAYRSGKYKIHFSHKDRYSGNKKEVYEMPHLYNVEEDPSEKYNIAKKLPEIVAELTAQANKHKESITVLPSLFDN